MGAVSTSNLESIARCLTAESALARLFAAQGQGDAAQRRGATARAIAEAIEKSLESSGIEAQLRMR